MLIYPVGNPAALANHVVFRVQMRQDVSESAIVKLRMSPKSSASHSFVSQLVVLQESLGETVEMDSSAGDWGFMGIVTDIAYHQHDAAFELLLTDYVGILQQRYHNRIFADTSLSEIVTSVCSPYPVRATGKVGNHKVKSAIQYEMSDFDFVAGLLDSQGGEIWCSKKEIVFGDAPLPITANVRPGREIHDLFLQSSFMSEKVSMTSLSIADKKLNTREFQSNDGPIGSLESAIRSVRNQKAGHLQAHTFVDDPPENMVEAGAAKCIRHLSSSRLRLRCKLYTPVPLGSLLKIVDEESSLDEVLQVRGLSLPAINAGSRSTQSYMECFAETPPHAGANHRSRMEQSYISLAKVSEVTKGDDFRVRVMFPWDTRQLQTTPLRVVSGSWGSEQVQYLPPEKGDIVLVVWSGVCGPPIIVGSLVSPPNGARLDSPHILATKSGLKISYTKDSIRLENTTKSCIELRNDCINIVADTINVKARSFDVS